MQNDSNFKDVKDLPLLTAEREKELGSLIQRSKGGKAKENAIVEMVNHNLKLVVKEAHRYSRLCNVSVEELYNAGRKGLIRAIYDYRPDQFNNRFSTYAIPWIRQGIRETVRNESPVYIPVHVVNGVYRKNKAIAEKGEMSDVDLKEELDLTDAQMERINKAHISAVSLDTPVGSGADEGSNKSTIGDFIADENASVPGEDGISGVQDERYDYLEEAMSGLDEISRDILTSQIICSDKVKLSDLGEKYGITGERVRQIKQKALKALRKKIVYRMKMNGKDKPESKCGKRN